MYSACPHGPHAEGRQTDCHSHKEHSSRAKNQIQGSWILQDHLSNELCKQIRHTWHYTAGPPIFHKMKSKNKMTKTCSEKSALKNPVWGSKQNWHALPPAVCTEKKIMLVFIDYYFLIVLASKQQLTFPILSGRRKAETYQSLNKEACQRVGIFLL